MRRTIILAALALSLAVFGNAQNIAGDWQGTLQAGQQRLRLVLHVAETGDGGFKATLDSIDQGARGIPVSSVKLKDSKLSLGVEAVHASFHGKVNADATAISGEWEQMGNWLSLTFKRLKVEAQP